MQFFLYIYAARVLGVDLFGVFSFGFAVVSLLSITMDLGVSNYMVQQLSRDSGKTARYTGAGLAAKSGLIGVGLVLILMVGVVMQKEGEAMWVLLILGTGSVLDNITALFYATFEAREEMHYPAGIIAVSNFVMSATGLALLFFRPHLLGFCLVFVLGAFLRLVLSGIWSIRRYGFPKFPDGWDPIFQLVRQGLPFAMVTIFVSIYYYIDTVILAAFCDNTTVGHYNAAYRLLEAPLFISQAVTTALFPAASKLFSRNREELRRLTAQAFQKTWAFGLSVALATALMAENLIDRIYGDAYGPSGALLAILIFSVAIIMPSTICGTTIRAIDKQRVSALVTGIGAALNIVINLILVPHYGAAGAAWATVATEVFVLVVYVGLVWRYVGPVFNGAALARMALLVGLWIGAFHFMRHWDVLIQMGCCTGLFVPFMLAARFLTVGEVRRLAHRGVAG